MHLGTGALMIEKMGGYNKIKFMDLNSFGI